MRALRIAGRAWRLPWSEARDVVVAAALLVRAKLALTTRPFSQAIMLGSIPLGSNSGGTADVSSRWVKAVKRASYAAPWRSVCIHQGLALQRLLRRDGVPAILCYGTSQAGGKLKAHVWIKVGDDIVIGGEEAPAFHLVATYPSADRRSA